MARQLLVMSIVPSLLTLRDPFSSLASSSGSRAQGRTVDAAGTEQSADDSRATSALKEMQIAQYALRQIDRLDPLLQPIA
jgi:ABC-type cobalamin/Fe3+-siderophores transport system ATPase subunit